MQPAEYLKVSDPVLGTVIERVALPSLTPRQNYFEALVVEIINQQLSGKVADVMERRFRALFAAQANRTPARSSKSFWDGRTLPGFPEPKSVLVMPDAKIRTAGISFSKIAYIKNVARATVEGMLDPARLRKLSDEDVIAVLTQIKGIGRWTAEMFLMFTLARPDVFSYGDLGLKKAMAKLYRLRKPPSPERADRISRPWHPFRTFACRYLWEAID